MDDFIQGNVKPLYEQIDELKRQIQQLRTCQDFKKSYGAQLLKDNKELREKIKELEEYKLMYLDLCK